MVKFIGRTKELAALAALKQKRSASLVIVKGRRRIGKSRLLAEFASTFSRAFTFSGLAPEHGVTPQQQRDEFAQQFTRQLDVAPERVEDWGDLFWSLSQHTSTGEVLIIFDEISWMGSEDPHFLGKLKNAWDLYFKQNDRLILVLSGSVSTWIEENILKSTGFFGRQALTLTLDEMPLNDCSQFWLSEDGRVSAYEKLKVLAVTGGIPRYLESIVPTQTAEQNIQRLCFSPSGILFDEFEKIFSDLFDSRNELYKAIVEYLSQGATDRDTIAQAVGRGLNGRLTGYLQDLMDSGFVSRDYTWRIEDGKISKHSHYRLKDNYSRFYLKYILPNIERIRLGLMEETTLNQLANWYSIMGLQFENLVLNNRRAIKQSLQINPNDIVIDNPFFQKKGSKQDGCQIDYMIQTRHNVLYLCEVKFSNQVVGTDVIRDMQTKIERLRVPKQFSFRPVLIHVNGVSDAVLDQQYFSDIIDVGEYL